MHKQALFLTGAVIVGAGAFTSPILSGLPASIQSNATLQPIGVWAINNQQWIVIAGLFLILLAAFL